MHEITMKMRKNGLINIYTHCQFFSRTFELHFISGFSFEILDFKGHFFGCTQIDGDALGLQLLVSDGLTEFLKGRCKSDGQYPCVLATVADVSVTLERHCVACDNGRGRNGRVTHDDHWKHSRVNQILLENQVDFKTIFLLTNCDKQ